MEGLLAIDDATVAMIGTVIELLGAVLLMLNFTLGSKLLMLFTTCVTPIMHPFWRRGRGPQLPEHLHQPEGRAQRRPRLPRLYQG